MNYYTGLKEIGETGEFKNIPTDVLSNYINDFKLEVKNRSKQAQKKPELYTLGVVYSISYGQYADSGSIEKLAKNEEAIINLVKNDEYINTGKGVLAVRVDFADEKVYYIYRDWDDTIEQGILYLTKFEVVG